MTTWEEQVRDILTAAFYSGASSGLAYPKVARPSTLFLDGSITAIKRIIEEHTASEVSKAVVAARIEELTLFGWPQFAWDTPGTEFHVFDDRVIPKWVAKNIQALVDSRINELRSQQS